MPPTIAGEQQRLQRGELAHAATGRARVRAMSASIFCSTRQLIAAAAPATSAMPSVANSDAADAGGRPRRRQEHADHRGEDDQGDDARLGELEELLQP